MEKIVCEAKLGFHLMFPESINSLVHVVCTYKGNDKTKKRYNALVTDIINVNNPGIYSDIDDNGDPVNHMWLQDVYEETNSQVSIWNQLQTGDTIVLVGTLTDYKNKNIPKFSISDPTILQVYRNHGKFIEIMNISANGN